MRKSSLAILVVLAIASYFVNCSSPPLLTPVQKAYSSTCAIVSIAKTHLLAYGTGVVLTNDYILTAAHVIDINENGKLDDEEKEVFVGFDDTAQIIPCDVVAITEYKTVQPDVAILKPRFPTHRVGVLLSSDAAYERMGIGDKLISINRLASRPPTIIDGYLLHKGTDNDNSSLTCYFGSSGGGVYNSNMELVGLVESVATDVRPVICEISIFSPDGPMPISGEVQIVLPNNSNYTNLHGIKNLFRSSHLEFIEPSYGPIKNYFFAGSFMMIFLLLGSILVFKRD